MDAPCAVQTNQPLSSDVDAHEDSTSILDISLFSVPLSNFTDQKYFDLFRKNNPFWRNWTPINDRMFRRVLVTLLFPPGVSDSVRFIEILHGTHPEASFGHPIALTSSQAEILRDKVQNAQDLRDIDSYFAAIAAFTIDRWNMDMSGKDSFTCYHLNLGELVRPADGELEAFWRQALDFKRMFRFSHRIGECSLCLDYVQSNQRKITCNAKCGKVYHRDCVITIVSSGDTKKNRCPHCRQQGSWWNYADA